MMTSVKCPLPILCQNLSAYFFFLALLQHVLEKGKSSERAQIISKLAGQVVTMSQNKFASNVIEKCFLHGDIVERDLLIREIVEQTDGNDSLLVCMIIL
jgi:pumilio RNA-binding family